MTINAIQSIAILYQTLRKQYYSLSEMETSNLYYRQTNWYVRNYVRAHLYEANDLHCSTPVQYNATGCPRAAEVTQKNFHADDMLTSTKT